ncbi:MAG TPA: XRE family transcriptional regulator [Candidatus Tetragenococcus pullicola]|nr:XRE family transcriptional regulator [Candidatus Tetragenococcus pullicola]
MNKQKLRSIIVYNDDTQTKLANYLGMANQTFSKKINEKDGAEFSQTEIKLIKEKYQLSAEEIDDIFFSQYVS